MAEKLSKIEIARWTLILADGYFRIIKFPFEENSSESYRVSTDQ